MHPADPKAVTDTLHMKACPNPLTHARASPFQIPTVQYIEAREAGKLRKPFLSLFVLGTFRLHPDSNKDSQKSVSLARILRATSSNEELDLELRGKGLNRMQASRMLCALNPIWLRERGEGGAADVVELTQKNGEHHLKQTQPSRHVSVAVLAGSPAGRRIWSHAQRQDS
jgi:hypothetical protein